MNNNNFYFEGPNAHDLFEKVGKFKVNFEGYKKQVSVKKFKEFIADVEQKGFSFQINGKTYNTWSELRNDGKDGYFGLNGSKVVLVK